MIQDKNKDELWKNKSKTNHYKTLKLLVKDLDLPSGTKNLNLKFVINIQK